MDICEILSALCDAVEINGVTEAEAVAKKLLSPFAEVKEIFGGVIGIINPEGKKTLLLDAHIDEVGFTVTEVTDDGFLKVAPVGAVDARPLPGLHVKIHGKRTVDGVFGSVPPHLKKDDGNSEKLDELYIDTGLGAAAKDIILTGDSVSYYAPLKRMLCDCVTAKSLDDRAGAAALIKAAELIAKNGTDHKIIVLLSRAEEVGGIGAKTAAFSEAPDEAISVDVSFASQPGVAEYESKPIGSGAMIGVSPFLSKSIGDKLIALADKEGIPHTLEIMGGKTGTNADNITVTESGIPSALISIPLKNMHTPVEIVSTSDIEAVARLIAAYAKGEKI